MPDQMSSRSTAQPGRLDGAALDRLIADGDVDTVLVVFPDLQGRLVGKRVTGHFWRDQMHGGHGAGPRVQLPPRGRRRHDAAVGLRVRELGAGLRRLRGAGPTCRRLRMVPWLDKTALVLCDLFDEDDRRAGRGLAAPDPATPGRARRRRSATRCMCASELEFFLFRESLDEARRRATPTSRPTRRSSRTTTSSRRHATSTSSAQIRNGDRRRGRAGRVLEGRGGPRPARDQPRVLDARSRWPTGTSIYKNGAKEIARSSTGASITFMAKYSMDEVGSSCHVHSSLWDADAEKPLMWERRRARAPLRRCSAAGSAARSRAAASSRGCSPRPSTPTSATSPSRGRRPRSRGASTTARAASASSVTARSFRLESRIPGADVQPVPRVRGDDRGRPRTASSTASSRRRASTATRTRPPTSRGCRRASSRRSTRSRARRSRSTRSAPTCTTTSLNTARQEWATSTARSPTGSAAATSTSGERAPRVRWSPSPVAASATDRRLAALARDASRPRGYVDARRARRRGGRVLDRSRSATRAALLDRVDALVLPGGRRPRPRDLRRGAAPEDLRRRPRRRRLRARARARRDRPRDPRRSRSAAASRCSTSRSAARSTSTSPSDPGVEPHGLPGEPNGGAHPRGRRSTPGSLLAEVMGATARSPCRGTTTRRSTALGDGLRVVARADDGIVEGLELDDARRLGPRRAVAPRGHRRHRPRQPTPLRRPRRPNWREATALHAA